MTNLKKTKQHLKKDWHYCHECQLQAGGIVPKNQGAITVMKGKCTKCGEEKTLVPNDDYHWPGLRDAIND